jgi:hypothetical protein
LTKVKWGSEGVREWIINSTLNISYNNPHFLNSELL